MNTSQILDEICRTTGIAEDQAAAMLEAFATSLREYCTDMDAVAIPGFGTFQPVKRDEIIVCDKATGRRTMLPPSISVEFKSSVILRKQFV